MLHRFSLVSLAAMAATALLASSCGQDPAPTGRLAGPIGPTAAQLPDVSAPSDGQALLDAVNARLAGQGIHMAVARAELLTTAEAATKTGQVLFSSNHMLRLDTRWAPNDDRRLADGDNLTYLVDMSDGMATPGIDASLTEAAIDRAMATWSSQPACSKLTIVKRPDGGADPDIIDYFLGFGDFGNPFLADIVEAGFMPPDFFEALYPGGSRRILAVTFTLVFTDDQDNPTDIDNDHRLDTAVKEVYFNNAFRWSLTGSGGYDIQTVALHENGHSLELGHYGNLFFTVPNEKLHAAPRAVMNAVYMGVMRDLQTVDTGAFCGIYASWPR